VRGFVLVLRTPLFHTARSEFSPGTAGSPRFSTLRMEVDTENAGMNEADSAMLGLDDRDDGVPTVEETYEITTTRRKTIRTSYKIQEVSPQRPVALTLRTRMRYDPNRLDSVLERVAAWAFYVAAVE